MANPEHLAKLREGVAVWNRWRHENSDEQPNFLNADLNGSDLHSADLHEANLQFTDLRGADLRGADLNNTDLRSADLRGAHLNNTDLRSADLGGAHLDNADLQKVNLQDANLQRANLRDTNLQRANLRNANLLDADFHSANLQDADLCYVNCQRANLRDADLQRVNLQDANLQQTSLQQANLRDADLQRVNLQDANLQQASLQRVNLLDANLQRVNLLDANLQRSILTGACIHDWHINAQTQLDSIICDCIYQLSEWKDTKWKYKKRRPHDPQRNFEPGEFTKLFQIAAETIDLVFNNGIEWSAFITVFKQYRQEAQSNNINIQAIERKLGSALVVRVDVPSESNKSVIEIFFYSQYKRALKNQEKVYREKLKAKDSEIEIYQQKYTDILELAKLAANRPIAIENKNTMTEESKYDQRGAQFGGGFAAQGNQYGSSINNYNYAAENKQNLAEAAAEIRQLLDELAQSYPTETMPEKMVVATKAIEKIESDPNWKQRIVNAAKVGGVQALEKAIDNPFGAFVAGAIEGWQES